MDIKLRFSIPLSEALCEAVDLDEDTALEAYIEDGNLIVNTLDEDDLDSLVDGTDFCDEGCPHCDGIDDCPARIGDCENCPYYCCICDTCVYDEENE